MSPAVVNISRILEAVVSNLNPKLALVAFFAALGPQDAKAGYGGEIPGTVSTFGFGAWGSRVVWKSVFSDRCQYLWKISSSGSTVAVAVAVHGMHILPG